MATQTLKCKAGTVQVEIHDEDEHIQKYWLAGKFYEGSMLEWIRRHYKGGTFIDCGSSIGNHTLYFAAFCADKVISIEPLKSSVDHLVFNIGLNDFDNVTAYQCALGKQRGYGRMEYYAPDDHNNVGMHQLIVYDDLRDAPGDEAAVMVQPLDHVIQNFELDDVTLVKIDVEHLELDVLKGAENLLRTQRPALFVESPYEEGRDEITEYLAQLGYVRRSQHNPSATYEFIVPKQSPLKILSVSAYDLAGSGYFLSQALNEHTSHISRAIRWRDMRLNFPKDVGPVDGAKLNKLWKWADVIHIHDAPGFDITSMPKKPTVITHHGSTYRSNPARYNKQIEENGWIGTVSTLDLTLFGLPWMPDSRPDLSEYYDPPDEMTICHAPTRRGKKGTDRVIEACKRTDTPLVLVEAKPWQKCLEMKGRAHILFDQFTFGHGCNGIEAWMMGQAVIGDAISSKVLDLFEEKWTPIPFARPVPDLEKAIEHLRWEGWAEDAERGRQYALEYHSPESVANLASTFYHQAKMKFEKANWEKKQRGTRHKKRKNGHPRMPPKGQRIDEKLVVVKYLGQNQAETQWFPENGTGIKYKFSAGLPRRYVYESDVSWFASREDVRGNPLFKVEGQ
jgi:FkbM family methyltransferase